MARILFLGAILLNYAHMTNAACPVNAQNIKDKINWVLDQNRVLKDYYQVCLKGDNSPESIEKFIICKENAKECSALKPAGFCDNYCPGAPKDPVNIPPVPVAGDKPAPSELRCEGGSIHNGQGMCTSPSNSDPNTLNLLSYNLFWWSAFDIHGGQKLIDRIKTTLPADLLAFQECSNIRSVLDRSGLSCYASYDAGHAVALAWNPAKFEKLSANRVLVGLDHGYERYNANRVLGFVRLKMKSNGKTILFANIHGVLGVNSGGIPIRNNCEYLAHGDNRSIKDAYIAKYKTKGDDQNFARNIVDVIKANLEPGDLLILAGDFNIDKDHRSENPLKEAFKRVQAQWVDKIFINHDADIKKMEMTLYNPDPGRGLSDHSGLRVIFSL
jgi:hypothetical protein